MEYPAWGNLVGVRPSKLLQKLLDQELSYDESYREMERLYHISREKFDLLWQVCTLARPAVMEGFNPRLFSVYAGIPFCPSRCLYCSFPSHSLKELGSLRSYFVDALLFEIRHTGELARKNGLRVHTVYLGGGTPTSLLPRELDMLLKAMRQELPGEPVELTVEAGRPDTLTEEHLKVMQENRVTRISVNPQTMQESTLQVIGRLHSPQDIEQAVTGVRAYLKASLNMDLIVGLPGETPEMVGDSTRQVLQMNPENVTLHVFSRKRASLFNRQRVPLPGPETVVQMQNAAKELLSASYRPYYLYRQRDILGGLENVGYSLPGRECLYNILMIEERHNILGIGGGASSKLVRPDLSLVNLSTPKDVRMYLERVRETAERRAVLLEETLQYYK